MTADGHHVTRETLARKLRKDGHRVSTARLSMLLHLLAAESSSEDSA